MGKNDIKDIKSVKTGLCFDCKFYTETVEYNECAITREYCFRAFQVSDCEYYEKRGKVHDAGISEG